MTDISPPESHLDLLERPLFAHLATVAKDCSPRVNPMWFYWDTQAGVLKLTHTNQRHNFRNLQENPRVALSIVDPDDQYRYLQLRGEVANVEADPTGKAAHVPDAGRFLARAQVLVAGPALLAVEAG